MRLGGPFSIDVSRRLLSTTSLLSGAMFNAYSSSSLPFGFGDYKQKDWDVNTIFYNCSMDEQSEQTLVRLIKETRIAGLGTLHDGEPNLAMVAYSFAEDFSVFYIHVSKLGKHTADMENDPHVSLLITETDDRRADPQAWEISIFGNLRQKAEGLWQGLAAPSILCRRLW